MRSEKPEDFSHVEDEMRSLRDIQPARDPVKAGRGRARYLAQIEQISVSTSKESRHTFQNRIKKLFGIGKDGYNMSPALISVVTALVLFFSGGALSVSASQNSLPDEFLFPLKLATEDFRASLAADEEDLFNLELTLSETRLQETLKMLEMDRLPDDEQFSRLETHLNNALNLAVAAQTKNAGELQKLQNQLQEHARLMEQIQTRADGQTAQAQMRVKAMLESQTSQVNNWIDSAASHNSNGQNGSLDQTRDQTQDQTRDQTQDQTRDQTQDQTRDQTQDQTRDQTQDQTRDQTQDQLRLGNGTPTPPATMVPAGNNQNYGSGSNPSGGDTTGSGYSSGIATGTAGNAGSGNGSSGGGGKGK